MYAAPHAHSNGNPSLVSNHANDQAQESFSNEYIYIYTYMFCHLSHEHEIDISSDTGAADICECVETSCVYVSGGVVIRRRGGGC